MLNHVSFLLGGREEEHGFGEEVVSHCEGIRGLSSRDGRQTLLVRNSGVGEGSGRRRRGKRGRCGGLGGEVRELEGREG